MHTFLPILHIFFAISREYSVLTLSTKLTTIVNWSLMFETRAFTIYDAREHKL